MSSHNTQASVNGQEAGRGGHSSFSDFALEVAETTVSSMRALEVLPGAINLSDMNNREKSMRWQAACWTHDMPAVLAK